MNNNHKSVNKELEEGFGANCIIIGHRCFRCKHKWVPREEGYIPEICPLCKSPYWKSPKVRFSKKGKNK
jgi:uncharacterized OB-fold protein